MLKAVLYKHEHASHLLSELGAMTAARLQISVFLVLSSCCCYSRSHMSGHVLVGAPHTFGRSNLLSVFSFETTAVFLYKNSHVASSRTYIV
jgi:hypothetical protein